MLIISQPLSFFRSSLFRVLLVRPFNLHDQCNFATQLAMLLQAGLPLLNALILLRQSAPPHGHGFLAQLETQLRQGNPFSFCLRLSLKLKP